MEGAAVLPHSTMLGRCFKNQGLPQLEPRTIMNVWSIVVSLRIIGDCFHGSPAQIMMLPPIPPPNGGCPKAAASCIADLADSANSKHCMRPCIWVRILLVRLCVHRFDIV